MTCIAAVAARGVVWMGADSFVVDDETGEGYTSHEQKVFQREGVLLGGSGDCRWLNLLQYVFTPPARQVGRKFTDMHYLVGPFIDALHKCVASHHIAEPEKLEMCLLIGYRGTIYNLDTESYDVVRSVDDFDAAGSGRREARGVLAALASTNLAPRTKIMKALTISARYNQGVRAPFRVLSL